MSAAPGERLRGALQQAQARREVVPFVGIDDLFSASLAADQFQALTKLKHDDAPLAEALASPRDLTHCHAVLQANLHRARGQ